MSIVRRLLVLSARNYFRNGLCMAACTAVVFAAGCSGEKKIPTFPVTGKVLTAEGGPVDHALIVLHPQSSNATAPKPRGTTNADGSFELSTFNTGDGAPEGRYQVSIERWLRKDPNESPVNHLPPNLASPTTSGIEVEVKAGPNALDPFKLR
jgi:hypothetical protein